MKVEHRLTVVGRCPVDESADVYRVLVRTKWVVPVEAILEAVEHLTKRPIFQENFTKLLAVELGAFVQTIGTHSGVETTCECGE